MKYNIAMKVKPTWEIIRELRESYGLTREEFATRIGCSASYITHLEKPLYKGGKLPSEKIIDRIAQAFTETEEQRRQLKKALATSRIALLMDAETITMMTKDIYLEHVSMPEEFIERLKKDIKPYDLYIVAKKIKIPAEHLQAVLEGRATISPATVEALARTLGQPAEEYLILAGYMPERLKEIVTKYGQMVGDIFKRFEKIPPSKLEGTLRAIESILALWGGNDEGKSDQKSGKKDIERK
jgi:transcriptional regulator with XRE-family HTH domain